MANLTPKQKKIQDAIRKAEDTTIAYSAPEVPSLGNLTPAGLVEELGWLNVARKALEKTEKTVKERLKSMKSDEGDEWTQRSDSFEAKLENRSRNALDQTKAKAYFEEKGILPEYMVETKVPTLTVGDL